MFIILWLLQFQLSNETFLDRYRLFNSAVLGCKSANEMLYCKSHFNEQGPRGPKGEIGFPGIQGPPGLRVRVTNVINYIISIMLL